MRVLLFLLCFVTARFVHSSNDYATLQAQLDANRAKWRSQRIVGYDLTISRICFCLREAIGPFQATVRKNRIVRVSPDTQFAKDLPTVEGVFDFIQDAIKQTAANIEVLYDRTLGYPTRVFVDFDVQIADEESGFELEVKNVRKGPSKTVVEPPADANGFNGRLHWQNFLKWKQQRLRSYKYEFTRACFCAPDFVGPFVVTVKNDRVVKVEFKDPSKGPVAEKIAREIPTINGLFRVLRQEAAEADKVEIKYDPRLGYPTSAFFDRLLGAIDDEITYIAKLL